MTGRTNVTQDNGPPDPFLQHVPVPCEPRSAMLTDTPSAAPTSHPPPHRLSTQSPIPTRSCSALSHTWAGTTTRPHTAGCTAPTEQFHSPPRPSISIMPLDSCRLGEGSDPALAPTGACSLYHDPPPTHTQVTCREPSVAPATNTSCPSQNWPEQLAICSAVCPSVHWRRQSYLGALCGRGPATLWNSQKLTVVSVPPFGTAALAPSRWGSHSLPCPGRPQARL